MSKCYHLLMIELWWRVEHSRQERIAVIGYRKRKEWENKYFNKFNDNIYGQPL